MRFFIVVFVFNLVLGACATNGLDEQAPVSIAPAPSSLPNILLILSDDQVGRDVGIYGNPDVKTPNLDRLASEGMRFLRAYTGTAMCSASRQQLYTGIYPVRNGAYPNHSVVNEGTESIVTHLQAMGYRTGLNGKTHFGPDSSFPFEYLDVKPYPKNDTSLRFSETVAFMTRNTDQPFLLLVTSRSPHFPWTMGDQSDYDPNTITVPPFLIDTPETRAALANYYAEIGNFDTDVGRVLEMLEKSDLAENTIVIYTSEQGSMFPFAKWTLYDAGIKTAMIIRWPGRVRENSVANALVHYVDVVPTLLEIIGKSVSGLDGKSFLPVLLSETDEHNEYVFGVQTTRGITNWNDDYPIRSVRNDRYKLIWNINSGGLFSNSVIVKNQGGYYRSWKELGEAGDEYAAQRYRYYQQRPEFELYDLEIDPHELTNLAGNPDHLELQSHLFAKLQDWMSAQGDEGIATEQAGEMHTHGRDFESLRSNWNGDF